MKNHYLPSLDGIRAISIFLVIGSHVYNAVNYNDSYNEPFKYIFHGILGVNIFFVLSGFLITYLLLKEENEHGKIDLKNFYIRRLLRIFPVYYLFIGVLFILDFTTKVNFSSCEYLSSLLFFKNFGCGQWIDSHLWSLAVEEQFYLLWPFVLAFAPKNKRMPFALLLIILSPFFRIYFYLNELPELRLHSFFTNMDCLMIGSLTGMYYSEKKSFVIRLLSFKPHIGRILAFTFIYTIWLLEVKLFLGWVTLPFGKTLQSIGISYLICSYVSLPVGIGYKLLNFKPLTFIGILSYSLYIWQQLFLTSPSAYSDIDISFLHLPYSIFIIFIVATASYFLFEKPLMKLRHKFKKKRYYAIDIK